MNFRKKVKNYGFWTALAGAVILVLQACGLKVNVPYVNEIVSAALGILVALGIVSNPASGSGFADNKESEPEENASGKGGDDADREDNAKGQ